MDAIRRSSIGFGILVAVWIAVYWWWEPKPRAIAFDQGRVGVSDVAGRDLSPLDPGTSETVRQSAASSKPAPAETQVERAVPETQRQSTVDGVEAPSFRSYTVRRGDTLASIARRELGSTELASTLARANPLLDPTRLREGQTIRVPVDPANIQGREVKAVPAEQVENRVVEYQVREGDTLSEISRAVYGSTVHWRTILEANRATLKNEKALRAGQKLLIPPLASGDADDGGR